MGKQEKTETAQSNLHNIFFFALAILILVSIAFTAITYNSISSLNDQINAIDNALYLESEGHYVDVRNNIEKSVVLVLSSPVHSNIGESDEIYFDETGKGFNLGSGFSINDRGDILTAYHVVKDAKEVEILYDTGTSLKTFSVERTINNPELDVAILRVNSSIPPLKLQSGDIQALNSKLGSYIGYSGYIKISNQLVPVKVTVRGSVSGSIPITYQNSKVYAYVLGATANKGNSGGPVFSLKTGEVIGIINKGIPEIEGMTVSTAINQNVINNMLSRDQIQQSG